MPEIEFLMYGLSLGKTTVCECSTSTDRKKAAADIGIYKYQTFILDNGRVNSSSVTLLVRGKMKILDDFDN